MATKCDNPESARQVNTDAIPRHFPGILNLITSANVPSTARESLNAIIKASFSAKRGESSGFGDVRRICAGPCCAWAVGWLPSRWDGSMNPALAPGVLLGFFLLLAQNWALSPRPSNS